MDILLIIFESLNNKQISMTLHLTCKLNVMTHILTHLKLET